MKLIVNGAGGRMGGEIVRMARVGAQGADLAAAVDAGGCDIPGCVCARSLEEYSGPADCIVDFSHPAATEGLLAYAAERSLPVVIATTGHTEEQRKLIETAALEIPVFLSANMSLGVAALMVLAETAARLFPDADIEIVEKHHNQKRDVPSGTALWLADRIRRVRPGAEYVVGRSGQGKRKKNEIGIHALRMGNIVGEHEILISTGHETLALKHEAHDRALFAEGALRVARFLIGRPPGLYGMEEMTEAR